MGMTSTTKTNSMEGMEKAITELFAQDGRMLQTLGAWYVEHHTK
jgi:hypothetical protein